MTKLVAGRRYIVTRSSDDGTFRIGDRIRVDHDGSILCAGEGWITHEDVEEASKGIEVILDKEWYRSRKIALLAELDVIEEHLNGGEE